MPKQKTIQELEAEIAAKERQLAQLQHRQQQLPRSASLPSSNTDSSSLKTAAATTRTATAANGHTASSLAERPSKAWSRWQRF